MHSLRLFCFVLISVCLSLPGAAAQEVLTADEFQQGLTDLASKVFARRQHAAKLLSGASVEQIDQLQQTITANPDNEVVLRVIEILEVIYQQPRASLPEVRAASELLEVAAESERWFAAEAARDILKRHWKRRVELSIVELVNLGASVSPQDPEELWRNRTEVERLPFRIRGVTGPDQLRIHVKETWPRGPRGMELVRRLEGLASNNFLRDAGEITIILVDGHPLTVEEVGVLKGIFGDAPLQERGRVSLGISPDNLSAESGVTVGAVTPESSADVAGIRARDVIVAINGEKVPDFEALVTMLRRFSVGQKVTMKVRKEEGGARAAPVDVEVTLQDWR